MADSIFRLNFGSCIAVEAPAYTGDVHCLEEQALIEGLREGVEEAYEALLDRFQQPVYNLVCRLVNDPSEAGDVVQDVFFKIFRNIGDFRGKSSLKTWLYRIAVNEAYNHRRWYARHRGKEIGLESGEDDGRSYRDILADRGRSPHELAVNGETREMIEQALGELNPVFRAAVVLRDMEDLSYEEIAEILQVSLGTVKSRITRGREALRSKLAGKLEARPLLGLTG